MSLLLIFLGLGLVDTADDSLAQVSSYASNWLPLLVSIDPLDRIRAAWFLPEFSVKFDTLTVAAGRPQDVRILFDDAPLWDPQTGENTVKLPQNLIADADLVITGSSLTPATALYSRREGLHAELSGTYPFFLDFENPEGHAEVMLNIPVAKVANLSLDGAAILKDNSLRTNLVLPYQGIAAATGGASVTLTPSDDMLVRIRYLYMSEQRDHFTPAWIFNPSSAPARLTETEFALFSYNYRTDALRLKIGFSGYTSFLLETDRKEGDLKLFSWFEEQDSALLRAARDVDNPFGVKGLFYSQGGYPFEIARNSSANRAFLTGMLNVGEINEIHFDANYTTYNIIADITTPEYYLNYQRTPNLTSVYAGDRLRLHGLWVEPGLGFLYLQTEEKTDTGGSEITFNSIALQPRLEAGILLGETVIGAGTELVASLPGFEYFYDHWEEPSNPDTLVLTSDERPGFERSWRSWLEIEGTLNDNISLGLKGFAGFGYNLISSRLNPRDSSDTVPSAGVFLDANETNFGLCPWFEYNASWIWVRAAYRFASGKGTSAGVLKDYEALLSGASVEEAQRLPFDSRHKLVAESRFLTPATLPFWAREFFLEPRIALASGFPSEETDEGAAPWWAWCELAAGRTITIGGFQTEITAELLNPFGWTEPILGSVAEPALPTEEDFPEMVTLSDPDYHPSRDVNHDGYITAAEEVEAYARARAYYDEVTPSPLPGRSVELKLAVRF
ncbi:hypothetical protein JXM67_01940 [candidate division WOR-3 bacterium]|nr:hypothetical protein [candidate division WOR-3 bacterium]